MTDAQIWLFVLSSLAVIMTPGQDFIMVLSRGLGGGSRAGMITGLGVCAGLLGHTALATLGLGALLLASETLFNAVKYLGAAYLVYLGIQLLRSRSSLGLSAQKQGYSMRQCFLSGALSNIANPKITIFYLAYLPQFVSPTSGSPGWQLCMLGVGYAALALLVKVPAGYLAGRLAGVVAKRPEILAWQSRISGLILVGLGVRLAMSQRV